VQIRTQPIVSARLAPDRWSQLLYFAPQCWGSGLCIFWTIDRWSQIDAARRCVRAGWRVTGRCEGAQNCFSHARTSQAQSMSELAGAAEQPSGVQHATDTEEDSVEIQDIHVTDTYVVPLVLEPLQDSPFWATASALAWPAATGVACVPQLEAVAPLVSPAIEFELHPRASVAAPNAWSGGWRWDSWSSTSWSDWSGWSGWSSGWDQSDWSGADGVEQWSQASSGDRQACRQS
jgi:hypothetical protein